mgnify:CR=1 FL=1
MLNNYILRLKSEFKGYNSQKLVKDILAGLTVAAVALPLALAFGVSSGADAGAGLITAIVAGLLIGGLSGASYQISGPTGAMSAILIGLSTTYGLQGVFVASFISGVMLLIASLFKFGKVVSFIPSSVITGFTSGIAIIIATGQIDNFFGVTSKGGNTIEKLFSYSKLGFPINKYALMFGLLVVFIMLIWPKKWGSIFPSSLAGIIIALIVNLVGHFDVTVVGKIPTTLFPDARLSILSLNLTTITHLIIPAFSIAMLGMIESILCGASAGKMKNEKLDADMELFAQGVGNMVIPFFGGVPTTAAIARTSVAIKAGGQTRLVSIFHAIALLRNRIKTSMTQFLVTMLATVVFDLTVAIVLGICVSMFLFVINNSSLHVETSAIEPHRLDKEINYNHSTTQVVYLAGPLFFGNQDQLLSKVRELIDGCDHLILSVRGVPSIDDSGIHELMDVVELCRAHNVKLYFTGVQNNVMRQLRRHHFDTYVGEESFYWDVIKVIEMLEEK